MRTNLLASAVAACGLAAVLQPTPANADAIMDFYKGKRMTMMIGLSPGGGYDRYARLTARYLQKYIPGNPRISAKNMTGGGAFRVHPACWGRKS